jgi:hypothetical protein
MSGRSNFTADGVSMVLNTDDAPATDATVIETADELRKLIWKPPRIALPLSRYVERKSTGAGRAYFFHVPTWAKRAGCPLHSEALGLDYSIAVKRAEEILLPAFDAWRSGDTKTAAAPAAAAIGTLDWVFAEYRADRRFTKLDAGTKRNHENGF